MESAQVLARWRVECQPVHAALASILLLAAVPAGPSEPALTPLSTPDAVARALKPGDRPLLVHFWALWCPPCMEELPLQVSLARKAREAGADVVFVSVDQLDQAPLVRARLQAVGGFDVARQVLLDMNLDVASAARWMDKGWGGTLPATFAVVGEGRVAAWVRGQADARAQRRLLAALTRKPAPRPPRAAPKP